MEKLLEFIHDEKVQGCVAILAAVVMYFTPDCIDKIIEMCLAAMGIQRLTLKKE